MSLRRRMQIRHKSDIGSKKADCLICYPPRTAGGGGVEESAGVSRSEFDQGAATVCTGQAGGHLQVNSHIQGLYCSSSIMPVFLAFPSPAAFLSPHLFAFCLSGLPAPWPHCCLAFFIPYILASCCTRCFGFCKYVP